MQKVLFCTPYEGISSTNIGGIAVWAKAVVAYYEGKGDDFELTVQPIDRKTYVRGVNAFVRIQSGVNEYIGLVRRVKRCIKNGSYNVLHLCTTASLGLLKDMLILKYAKSKGLKTVLHFHCGRIPQIIANNNWETKLLFRVLSYTDVPMVMDERSLKALQTKGVKGAVNMPNPLSSLVADAVAEYGTSVKRVKGRLLFVGHIVDIKGVYELVEACSRMSGVELRMVGHVETAVKEQLLTIASRRSGEWISFTGGLSRKETIHEMLEAELLVAPSYIEGFPNVIIESMACGTPVVASSVGAIPEMLDNGKCGVLIEPKNVEAICSAVQAVVNDEEKRKLYSSLSKERVYSLYSISSVCSKLFAVWKSI